MRIVLFIDVFDEKLLFKANSSEERKGFHKLN